MCCDVRLLILFSIEKVKKKINQNSTEEGLLKDKKT